jgi:hypothetical protein
MRESQGRSHEAAFETNYSDSQVTSTASTQIWLDDVLHPIADPAPRSLQQGSGQVYGPAPTLSLLSLAR